MMIIDAHLHFSHVRTFHETARSISHVDYSAGGLRREFAGSHVTAGIGMGLTEMSEGGFPDSSSPNPMLLDLENDRPAFLACCPGINPMRLSGRDGRGEIARIREVLMAEWAVGLKIYAGYYPFFVHDQIYEPIYDLAAEAGLPVVVHSGVTYSERALLKYSHPLAMDELAVRRRDVNFVLAHLGDPWVMDTAAVVLKNPNVYADLSGLIVGDAAKVAATAAERAFTDRIRGALVFDEMYHKFLFGSDWPLAPLGPYIEFVRNLIPAEHHEKVFYGNAMLIFSRLQGVISANP